MITEKQYKEIDGRLKALENWLDKKEAELIRLRSIRDAAQEMARLGLIDRAKDWERDTDEHRAILEYIAALKMDAKAESAKVIA